MPYTRPASQAGRFCSKAHADAWSTANAKGHVNADGYRVIPDPIRPGKSALEHRVVATAVLGRPLLPTEEVHHCNGNRSDNRVDGPFRLNHRGQYVSGNLEVWSTKQPKGQEIGPKLDWALDLIDLYLDDVPSELATRAESVLTAALERLRLRSQDYRPTG